MMGTPHQRPREPAWRLSRLPGASLEAPQHHSFFLEGPACWVLLIRDQENQLGGSQGCQEPAWRPPTSFIFFRRPSLLGTPHQRPRDPAWRLSRLPGASLETPQHHLLESESLTTRPVLRRAVDGPSEGGVSPFN